MPHIDKHPAGQFCWVELGTTDQTAAKQFYGSLFGWLPNDMPMGPSHYYTMFQLQGRDSAAAYTLDPQRMPGVPPHWMLYIAVNDVDATAAQATKQGGQIAGGPFDVMEFGRMAVLQDPAGATFSIWQAKANPGLGITGENGTLCWADLMTNDPAPAQKFYSSVFGWKITPGEHDPSGYLHIKNGETFIGGMPPGGHLPPGVPPHWLLYFLTSNCDASAEKAKSLGGRIHMGPMTIENVGRMATIADPQGAVFAIFQAGPGSGITPPK